MIFFNRGSIRKNLTAVIFLAVLPAIGILFYSGIEYRQSNIKDAEKEVLLLAHTMAQIQKELTLSIHEVLSTLALTTEIQTLDAQACNNIFQSILDRNPNYLNISLISLNGDVLASCRPSKGVNLADRKQFRDALSTKGFVSGEFILTRMGKNDPAFPFAHPVLDETGAPKAVLALAVDLTLFSRLYNLAQLPEDSFVAITDHQGIRLFYYPPKETTNPIGQPIKKANWQIASQTKEPSVMNVTGSDGKKRIIAFEQVRLKGNSAPYMYVWVGVPESFILAPTNTILKRNLLLMVLATIGALFITWGLGQKALIKPIHNLIAMTGEFSRGNFKQDTMEAKGIDEFQELTHSFHEMAESLSVSQDELRKSEERFKTLSSLTFEGVVIHPEGIISDVNDSLVKLFGFSREEMIGNHVIDLLFSNESHATLYEDQGKDHAGPYEVIAKKSDGTLFPVEIESRNFQKGGEVYRVSAVRDISERKLIETQNKHMARLADLGEMATGVAHEINNPISGVINCAELLKSKLPEEDYCQGIADRILREGNRIANIVRALLAVAHPGSSEELFNIKESLDSVITLYEHKLEVAGINVTIQAPENLPLVKGDRQKIEQVLINLISNAHHALNRRFPEQDPEKNLNISLSCHEETGQQYLCIEIYDQGAGIPEEIIDKIYDPFFTTKPAGSGTGIGLALCHQIVYSHGGSIRVDSEPGNFTRFTIELPVT